MNPKIDVWAVSALRSSIVDGYSLIATMIVVYWLITALLGRGQFLKIKSANVALVLSGVTFGCGMAIASIVQAPKLLFKEACPAFGLPDTMPAPPSGTFQFDGQTSCETFASRAVLIVLLGLPLILFATSAILRIVVSRRS